MRGKHSAIVPSLVFHCALRAPNTHIMHLAVWIDAVSMHHMPPFLITASRVSRCVCSRSSAAETEMEVEHRQKRTNQQSKALQRIYDGAIECDEL